MKLQILKEEVQKLEDLPNIGKAAAADLRLLGIFRPQELVGKDPMQLYLDLCERTHARHDPCVLDTFMSAVRFMEGAPALPWWAYTKERKALLDAKK
ncbi:helix-hairpin-helix domain-containing protein [Undibacterium terreum]|uniref:Pathogenicity locus n=1 Tax=Undibacterium terreum TaxID=1224302 RepID=A0A916U340_9BURK|nr:helix-hairpin-helix domain-containing protein [Undibacterium terreum]GGC58719.1 hypothetical protein GCM10011396_02020 [Undibacterium terreum]